MQSGKIVRRIIQFVSEDEEIGDLSSIVNPEALDEIAEAR
jgi:acetyl-CoA synthetase